MPKQSFGGDDDKGDQQQQPVKKLDLKKYASKPDINIREIFWDLLANYAMRKKITKDELAALAQERIVLVKIALNVLENPQSAYFGLGRNLTAFYSLVLFLDAEWGDAFEQYVVKSYEDYEKPSPQLVAAINRACENEKYCNGIMESFKKMIRAQESVEATLAYLSRMDNEKIFNAMKKEVEIIAKSDIEKNQHYAMRILAKNMDEQSKNTIIGLMNHWDVETRKIAIELLKKEKDQRVTDVAKRQLMVETDQKIKKALASMCTSKKEDSNTDLRATIKKLEKKIG